MELEFTEFSPEPESNAIAAPAREYRSGQEHRREQDYSLVRSASGLQFSIPEDVDKALSLPAKPNQLAIKRAMDVVLAGVAIVFLSPFLVAIAVLVKLTSPGPVLFVQERPGRHGKLFPILKFRTMYAHLEDRSGAKQTVLGDQRITPIGRWLRKTSIDELPQLLNVLVGQMSLVGPRPHPVHMLAGGRPYEELVPYYSARLAMRPGLSGWAQVNRYRGPTETVAAAVGRIHHDLAYVQNYSLALDLRIIAATVLTEFFRGSGF